MIDVLKEVNMPWKDHFNIAKLSQGSYRSIAGYAAESLIIGRAMQCGYNLFFKAWRDSPYDGVLDYAGVLFRVEIKGSTTGSLSVTSGGRAGAQINREAEDRTHLISSEEVDFVLGVSNLNGDCFLIPVDIIQIFGNSSLSFEKIEIFKEKWGILKGYSDRDFKISTNDIKNGFLRIPLEECVRFAQGLGINTTQELDIYSVEWSGFRRNHIENLDFQKYLAVLIWQRLFNLTRG